LLVKAPEAPSWLRAHRRSLDVTIELPSGHRQLHGTWGRNADVALRRPLRRLPFRLGNRADSGSPHVGNLECPETRRRHLVDYMRPSTATSRAARATILVRELASSARSRTYSNEHLRRRRPPAIGDQDGHAHRPSIAPGRRRVRPPTRRALGAVRAARAVLETTSVTWRFGIPRARAWLDVNAPRVACQRTRRARPCPGESTTRSSAARLRLGTSRIRRAHMTCSATQRRLPSRSTPTSFLEVDHDVAAGSIFALLRCPTARGKTTMVPDPRERLIRRRGLGQLSVHTLAREPERGSRADRRHRQFSAVDTPLTVRETLS